MTPDDRDVLLIVDVQNDFCPGEALAVPDGNTIVPAVNRLARSFAHVILTQDWHPPGHASFASSHPGKCPFDAIEVAYGTQILWPDHCVQGTQGAGFDLKGGRLSRLEEPIGDIRRPLILATRPRHQPDRGPPRRGSDPRGLL